ncbi:MAG: hypothetical protein DRG20_05340 [Deltaproteobacteria bacterium]|nr:MAG: hypothetical protein DRG20_05340 [Deltaproteobacteria bacterium]
MKILIVNPPTLDKKSYIREGRCTQPKGAWGTIWPPISLAYIGALLEKNNHIVSIIDCAAINFDIEELLRLVDKEKPDIIFLSTSTPTINSDLVLLKRIKGKNPSIITIAFGTHVTSLADLILKSSNNIDFIIRGEPEKTSEELVNSIESNGSFEKVKGISFRDDYGKIIHNPNREWIENLDDLPFPAWHLIDISRYKLPYIGSPFLMVTPHRGCPYNCTFCTAQTYYGSKIRIRSVQNVISELWYLKNRFNIDHIFFWSDTFTGNKKFVKDLCKAIIDEKLSIHWTCNSRIDTVDIELLQIMKKAGCFMISYGIESADPSILSSCGKKTTPEKAKEAVRLTKKAGIMTVGHFILGLPGETEKSANKSIMFAKSIGLDFAQFYFAVPFPGSRLYQTAVKEGWIEKGDFSSFEQDSCIMNLPTITKNKLESLRKKAYKEFYLRPSIIPWGIKHIRFNHIIESIKIALNFIKWSKGEKKM